MRKLTFAQATLEAMAEEMKKDDKVYVIGEDIALIVFLHFLGHRLQRGLCKRQFTHDSYLLQSA